MIRKTIHTIIVCLLSAVLFSCGKRTKELSLKETFSKNDKIPFGTYVLFNELSQLFQRNNINVKKQKFAATYDGISDTNSLYVCVSKNFFPGKKDNEAILSYVSSGNDIFISSEGFDYNFLDTLGLKTGRSLLFTGIYNEDTLKYTSVHLTPAVYTERSSFAYFYEPFTNYFSRFDSSFTKVLGYNEYGDPNFIVLFYGNGRIYLHSEPRALSNYFLLQKDNYKYAQQLFSFIPAVPERIFWDDFYNKRNYPVNDNDGSGLGMLLKFPALAAAFWLLLLLVAIYIIFNGKRRQRTIPVVQPNVNTTVAFTETIGRLYLQKKNNRNIADKIIVYFLEHIRNRYYLNTNNLDENFIDLLSRKSTVAREQVDQLFEIIRIVQQEETVTDHQLLILNQRIENFYKNKI
ncbi:MAG: hypothetical protein QM791_05730 [Ferruginibacter sp.]